MNKKTAGMSAYDKISYFNDVMSSPEFKAHTEELIKTAQEQKARAEGKKGVEGADGDTAIKYNTKQEAVNSDNAKTMAAKGVEADNVSVKNEVNTNNNINSTDNSVQEKAAFMNENVGINDNADTKNDAEDKANVNNELSVNKQDVFNNGEKALSDEGSNDIDTDNGQKENNHTDDSTANVSNVSN